MKKTFFLLSLFTVCAYGMEQSSTIIKFTAGSVFDVDGTTDIMVIGTKQQQMLQQTSAELAHIHYLNNQVVYVKKNYSNDVEIKIAQSNVLRVREPKIVQCVQWNHHTHHEEAVLVYRKKIWNSPHLMWSEKLFTRDGAVKEALKDLTLCYHYVLNEGLKLLKGKQKRNISIPMLSSEFFLGGQKTALIAIKAIGNFVNTYPTAYSCIELFVKEEAEVEQYNTLLFLVQCGETNPEAWMDNS